jgi:hypothetical protein
MNILDDDELINTYIEFIKYIKATNLYKVILNACDKIKR